jgi:hypothetical protein
MMPDAAGSGNHSREQIPPFTALPGNSYFWRTAPGAAHHGGHQSSRLVAGARLFKNAH